MTVSNQELITVLEAIVGRVDPKQLLDLAASYSPPLSQADQVGLEMFRPPATPAAKKTGFDLLQSTMNGIDHQESLSATPQGRVILRDDTAKVWTALLIPKP